MDVREHDNGHGCTSSSKSTMIAQMSVENRRLRHDLKEALHAIKEVREEAAHFRCLLKLTHERLMKTLEQRDDLAMRFRDCRESLTLAVAPAALSNR